MLKFEFEGISFELLGGNVKVQDKGGAVQASIALPPKVRDQTRSFVDGIIATLEDLKKNLEE